MSATLFHPVTRRRTYGPHISVYYFQSARDQLSITDFLSVTGIDHGRSASDAWSPLPALVDGGSSSTTAFDATVDGGSSSTTSFTATVDGGTSSDTQWSGLLDVATRSLPRSRTTSDLWTISDVVPRIVHDARFTSDSWVVAVDVVIRTQPSTRSPSDSVAISDSATRTAISRARSSSDSFVISDSATKQNYWSRTTSDAFTIGENPTRLGWARTTSDAFAIATDLVTVHFSVSVHGITYVSKFDQIGTQSSQLGTLFYIGNDVIAQNGEVVPVFDATKRGSTNLTKSSVDSVSISDASGRGYAYFRTASDSVAIADSAGGSVSRLYGSQIGMRTSELGYLFQVGNQY